MLDRRAATAEAIADEIDGIAIEVDVADGGATTEAIDAAVATLGGLDVVVANAGMGLNKPLHLYKDHEWRLVIG